MKLRLLSLSLLLMVTGCSNLSENGATSSQAPDATITDQTYKAATEINDLARSNAFELDSVDITYGPQVPDAFKDSFLKDLESAMKFWQPYVGILDFKVIAFSAADLDWLIETRDLIGGDFDPVEQMKNSRTNCNWSIMTNTFKGEKVIYICTNKRLKSEDRQTIPHEYFHIVQSKIRGSKTESTEPCWVLEGAPTFFGAAIGFYDEADSYDEFSRKFFSRLLDDSSLGYDEAYRIVSSKNIDEIKNLIVEPAEVIQGGQANNCGPTSAYFVGAFLSEYLVVNYGVDKFVQFMSIKFSAGDWKAEFERIYGVSVDEFYTEGSKYIAEHVVHR